MQVGVALSSAGIDKSDAEVLLATLLGQERTWLMAHPDYELSEEEEARWEQWKEKRRGREPVAHIIGYREFYGRLFEVDASTLIPRPATERLCGIALELLAKQSGPVSFEEDIDQDIIAAVRLRKSLQGVRLVADIGTGSGCIGITLSCERPDLRIIATDISAKALSVASRNAAHLWVKERMSFAMGNALDPLAEVAEPFLIVSNPPYIPAGTELQADVAGFEPHDALFSGSDGGDVIRDIVASSQKHPHCVGYVLECRKDQLHLLD